jgi:Mg-chelatase subunit ChlD
MVLPRSVRKIAVFLSSPSDMQEERHAAQRVIRRLNRMPHIARHFVLELLAYEHHVPGVVGAAPQTTVDRYMMEAEQCDLFLCFLWQRMGTPVVHEVTGERFHSGTEYEFVSAYRGQQRSGRPQMLLYRCLRPISPDADLEQVHLVQKFFERFRGPQSPFQGLYKTFQTTAELEEELLFDLDLLLTREAEASPTPQAGPTPAAGRTDHTADGWARVGKLEVQVEPIFDRSAYERQSDPLVRFLVEMQVRRADPERAPGKVPADLFLVLDVSGSMNQPDRYPLLRQAVRQLIRGLDARDRLAIAVFSTDAEMVQPPLSGAEAADHAADIIERMDQSHYLFGGSTQLAPGLRCVLAALQGQKPADGRVRRVYVLTDGELHDSDEVARVLTSFPQQRLEVHAYGFGTQFDAAALKRLLSDQRGGSVKPICNEQDVVQVFEHVASLAGRLATEEATLTVQIAPGVVCGDAWQFRPQERYLHKIPGALVRDLGPLEVERIYSVLCEVRLPVAAGPRTLVGSARLAWREEGTPRERVVSLEAVRADRDGQPDERIGKIAAILEALRDQADQAVRLSALKAKLDLAILEKRDPDLIGSLRKQIDVEEGRRQVGELDEADRQQLDADCRTWVPALPAKPPASDESSAQPPPTPMQPESDESTVL